MYGYVYQLMQQFFQFKGKNNIFLSILKFVMLNTLLSFDNL